MSSQSKYDVIIIGAGIGGLTCGNILAKNGLKVLILEKNPTPGGAVSTFFRNGFPIDISHSICGLNKNSYIRRIFDYLDLSQKLNEKECDKSFIHISSSNNNFYCYADIHNYLDELITHFPDEQKGLNSLFQTMDTIWNKQVLRSYYNPGFARLCVYPLMFPHLVKYLSSSFDQFLNEFVKSSDLKDILSVCWPYIGLNRSKVSALYMICLIMSYHKEGTYFIKGGIGQVSNLLSHNFTKLGGNIFFNTEVTDINITHNTSSNGVKTLNGTTYFAEKIVSNVDIHTTFLKFIGANNLPNKISQQIQNTRLSCSGIQVHLNVEANLSDKYLNAGSVILDSQIPLDPLYSKKDQNIATSQKSSLVISFHTQGDFLLTSNSNIYTVNILCLPVNYSSWKIYHGAQDQVYQNEKDIVALRIYTELKKLFSFKRLISYNVLTPLSYAKWLNATDGAIYDAESTAKQMLLNRSKFVMPIRNMYCVGAKSFPGPGIAGALCSGVSIADAVLKKKLTKGKFIFGN
jgi:all-trans-retinol 13,14-reductase